MMWLKACPRCKGDLYEETDHFGRYVSCAQCGTSINDAKASVLAGFAKREKDLTQSAPKPAVRRTADSGR